MTERPDDPCAAEVKAAEDAETASIDNWDTIGYTLVKAGKERNKIYALTQDDNAAYARIRELADQVYDEAENGQFAVQASAELSIMVANISDALEGAASSLGSFAQNHVTALGQRPGLYNNYFAAMHALFICRANNPEPEEEPE